MINKEQPMRGYNSIDFSKVVYELNMELSEENEELFFSYSTNGFVDAIDFNGMQLWRTDDGFETFKEETLYSESITQEIIHELIKTEIKYKLMKIVSAVKPIISL